MNSELLITNKLLQDNIHTGCPIEVVARDTLEKLEFKLDKIIGN